MMDAPWPWALEPGWQTLADLDWRDDYLAYPPRGPRILPAGGRLDFRNVSSWTDYSFQVYRP